MATTKQTATKTTAKKATAKKATAKKTAVRKTAAKQAAPEKAAAKKTTANVSTADRSDVRATISSVANQADDTFKQYNAVAGDQLGELRKLVRDVVDVYVGIPFVLGTRFAESATTPNVNLDLDSLKALVDDAKVRLSEVPSVDFDAVKSFIDEAKAVGHAQVTTFENEVSKRLRSVYAA
jgi:hypothetical protein